jgi:hypothetical protein
MRQLTDLQEFALIYLECVDSLKENDKTIFIKFINESTDKQVAALLCTGKMYTTTQLKEQVDGFGGEQLYKLGSTLNPASFSDLLDPLGHIITNQIIGGGMIIGAGALAALAIKGGVKAFKRYLTKAGRACAGLDGVHKEQCLRKYRIEATKSQIAMLEKNKQICGKTKDPHKCAQKIQKHIDQLKANLVARGSMKIKK